VLFAFGLLGKSVYLQQVGLIQILAQCGCYVPAQYASIRVCDVILTRMSRAESNLISSNFESTSSFHRECSELSHIVNTVRQPDKLMTDSKSKRSSHACRSLVLLDEPCESTAPMDGTSLAFTIAETLLHSPDCFTLIATHFAELTHLADLYSGATNLHMQVKVQNQDDDKPKLTMLIAAAQRSINKPQFLYRMSEGSAFDAFMNIKSIKQQNDSNTSVQFNSSSKSLLHYGIQSARQSGWPVNLTDEALRIAQQQ
jgi:DNA mismatch repair ATPase MutS